MGLLLLVWTPLAQAQKTPSEIYRETSPAVVLLMSSNPESSTQFKGTGFIIKRGLILTNAHVVLDDNNLPLARIVAFLPSDNPNDDNQKRLRHGHKSLILFYDTELDLALLITKTLPDVVPIPFGNSGTVSIGDSVLAIGHPENGGLWSLTSGRVGSKIQNFRKIQGKHVFQAEASINHGNSGGPLLNLNGQMIGVITSMFRTSSDGSAITGINFALQSKVVHQWLKKNEVSVALNQSPQNISSEVVASSEKANISENQDMSVSATSSATVSSEGTQPEIKPLAQITLPPIQNILPATGSPSKLLTPVRPYKDEDLFGQVMDKFDDDFDQMMNKMEKEFDDEMENFSE